MEQLYRSIVHKLDYILSKIKNLFKGLFCMELVWMHEDVRVSW